MQIILIRSICLLCQMYLFLIITIWNLSCRASLDFNFLWGPKSTKLLNISFCTDCSAFSPLLLITSSVYLKLLFPISITCMSSVLNIIDCIKPAFTTSYFTADQRLFTQRIFCILFSFLCYFGVILCTFIKVHTFKTWKLIFFQGLKCFEAQQLLTFLLKFPQAWSPVQVTCNTGKI